MPQGSERIREVRLRLGLSQMQLAVRAGVSQRTIQFAEAGKANLRPNKLKQIADALNISFEEAAEIARAVEDDQCNRLPWSISRFIREKAVPGQSAYCQTPEDAISVIRQMRTSWKQHLQNLDSDHGNELFASGDQKLNEAFFGYQQRYLSIWRKHPGCIQLAHCNGICCGVSVVLPVTDASYERFRDGEISFMDISEDDIEEESQNLILDSAVEIGDVGKTPWHHLTDSLIYALFCQIAVLSVDPTAKDFRMVSFGASPLNFKRLKSLGFQTCNVAMPDFGFPVCEFCLAAGDIGDDQYANASTTAHFAHLLRPPKLAATKSRITKRVLATGLKTLQRIVKAKPSSLSSSRFGRPAA